MNCPQCGTEVPTTAHYCHACGRQVGETVGRSRGFAVKPDEKVRSLRLVSTVMPTGAAEGPRRYAIAFGLAVVAVLGCVAAGWLPMALMVASLAVPLVYIIYLYDVNLWKDAPLPVTVLAFVLTAGLSAGFTRWWTSWQAPTDGSMDGAGGVSPLVSLAITALLVPVIGELLRQIGPLVLASRPRFDDLIDGLTFGIVSGVAYAAGDTLVRHWGMFEGGLHVPGTGLATWTTLLAMEGFVKPLVIGSATGLACAEFSGLGRGHDGFTRRYAVAVTEAIGWNVLYFGGVWATNEYLGGWPGTLTALLWGTVLLAVLVLRVRTVLQTALLEAALEDAARFGLQDGVGAHGELSFCPACEMPVLPHAVFCGACGAAMRSTVAGHAESGRSASPAPEVDA